MRCSCETRDLAPTATPSPKNTESKNLVSWKDNSSRQNHFTMWRTFTPEPVSQQSTTAFKGFKEPADGGLRLFNFDLPAIEPQPAAQDFTHHARLSRDWSAKRDFERRLSRNDIRNSKTADKNASKATARPTVQELSGARLILEGYARANAHRSNHYVSRSEDFRSLETASTASFTKRETKVEALERQLRQAQTVAQVWKRQSEGQEQDLRASYKETMKWRMKYEDLYSAVLQGVHMEPQGKLRRGATQSLG